MSKEYLSDMPDLDDKAAWQRLVMLKNYELAHHPDADDQSKALDRLAKTGPVALYEARIAVSMSTLSPEEIQGRLNQLVQKILNRPVISSGDD